MKNKPMEKFLALCDSGKPWYVFLVFYGVLLAASALAELLTKKKLKWSVWVLNALGILDCLLNIFRCRLQQEKAENE
mgnify:FL=1